MLHTDATGYGFLMTATGIGSLIAALGIAFSGRSRPLLIPLGAVVLGIGLGAAAVFNAFRSRSSRCARRPGTIAMAATANTTIQLAVPDELRGRVISVYTTVFVGSTPVGGLLMGWIASAFGVPASLAVAGVGSATAGLLALWWLSRIQARRGVPLATATTHRQASPSAENAERAPGGAVPVRPR